MDQHQVQLIENIVRAHIVGFSEGFRNRHEKDFNNPLGTINLKQQNIFLESLPRDFVFFSSLVRSFDSSFGGFLEKMALQIAEINYDVETSVSGVIFQRQLDAIGDMLTSYKDRTRIPTTSDYKEFNTIENNPIPSTHVSDHILVDRETGDVSIIELKAGGDLDNKKALAEKKALLEQYFIFKNENPTLNLNIFFATAYNKFGEGNIWYQPRVQTFFSNEELLIGRDFWNFICKDSKGFNVVIGAYRKYSILLSDALEEIKSIYNI